MTADLRGQSPRLVDPTMMLSMLISLVLMCHTWLLHQHDGHPPRSASEANTPLNDVSHVDIIGFDVSHFIIHQLSHPPHHPPHKVTRGQM